MRSYWLEASVNLTLWSVGYATTLTGLAVAYFGLDMVFPAIGAAASPGFFVALAGGAWIVAGMTVSHIRWRYEP